MWESGDLGNKDFETLQDTVWFMPSKNLGSWGARRPGNSGMGILRRKLTRMAIHTWNGQRKYRKQDKETVLQGPLIPNYLQTRLKRVDCAVRNVAFVDVIKKELIIQNQAAWLLLPMATATFPLDNLNICGAVSAYLGSQITNRK